MNDINVSQVLAQIRTLQAQAAAAGARSAAPAASAAAPSASALGGSSFASALKSAISDVNGAQQDATRLQKSFALGDQNVELSSVMLATAKAQVEFKAMTEVRNRLVAAYQDIMNMPL
ncbi:flagellar hook-basal body complex protein FliE [Solimonas aquatica]|uniref:Flagellar hook-basal body complex protein FliE n=1 Tax=Solimonas aquatica TaxID=489703 RepID=A0A1H9HJD4_9GAMM|nr:flagellar hook-basal body complex protein FliE [Solimonas aquatica]SEQ62427.1 flagellar hook-basal body complex protein FliE [Solimonas aquatica]